MVLPISAVPMMGIFRASAISFRKGRQVPYSIAPAEGATTAADTAAGKIVLKYLLITHLAISLQYSVLPLLLSSSHLNFSQYNVVMWFWEGSGRR